MKQFLFLFGVSLVACFSATAQINHPLVEEGKVWYFEGIAHNIHDDSNKVWEEIYSLEGDTVIGSYQCLKLYITCNSPYISHDHDYIGAMYEKRRKVYYIAPGNTTSTLLYDFSCDVGDIVKMNLYDIYMPTVVKWDEFNLIINDKQHVKYHDEDLTVMNWSPLYDDSEVVDHCTIWIESIGSPEDLLNSAPQWGATGISKELITCKLNDQIIYSTYDFNEYYPAPEKRCFIKGSKWTEIRLDTLKYDSWYSKIGNEWMPNFETVEYSVKPQSFGYEGKCSDYVYLYKVYTNGPDWSDSLSFVLYEFHTEDDICIKASSQYSLAQAYQFNWFVGKQLYYQNLVPFISSTMYSYGTIEEIKEGDFGGVRPLNYVDLNGVRIVQGIGVTEWNDGECLFGPVNLYRYSSSQGTPPERHYRSMLVHFERGDEVLYDVWPEKKAATETEPVTFTQDQMATIIFPTAPDASKGKYYRLDRCEEGKVIFEQELQPQARTPYIIVPDEDFSIAPSTLDLEGLNCDTVSIGGVSFIGSYSRGEYDCQEGWYIDIIDTTPDCKVDERELGNVYIIGALRAYLTVNWDDPINQDGTRGPAEKMEIVFHDHGTGLVSPLGETEEGGIYDLQGRRVSHPSKGVNIIRYSDETSRKILLK